VADFLFGAFNPAGRLTSTFYPASFIDAWKPGIDPYTGGAASVRNASFFDVSMRPNATTGNPGRSHRFYTGSPSFKFGDGISFTTFGYTLEPASPPRANVSMHELEAYSQAATTQHMFTRASPLAGVVHTVRVRVRNTGSVAGAHTVLAFVSPPMPGVDGAPLRSLIGFDKVFLEPGEATAVEFPVTKHDLTLSAPSGGRAVSRGEWAVTIGNDNELTVVLPAA